MALWTAILRRDITSVVTWAGVSDATATYWERIDMRRMMKRVIGGTPNRVPEAYDARTPLFEIEHITAPVLIIHGYQDENVDIEHARQLEFYLQDANKTYETWYDRHFAHQYPPAKNRETVHALCEWMKRQ